MKNVTLFESVFRKKSYITISNRLLLNTNEFTGTMSGVILWHCGRMDRRHSR